MKGKQALWDTMKHIEGLRAGFNPYTDNEKNIHCDTKEDVRYPFRLQGTSQALTARNSEESVS